MKYVDVVDDVVVVHDTASTGDGDGPEIIMLC